MVTDIDLCDPDLAPEHRIALVKAEVARLDELIARWYRRAACTVPGCDCGELDLAKRARTMCPHLMFIREQFGETIVTRYPHFNRFLREDLEPEAYGALTTAGAN
jgi:hypothetical protein